MCAPAALNRPSIIFIFPCCPGRPTIYTGLPSQAMLQPSVNSLQLCPLRRLWNKNRRKFRLEAFYIFNV